jgi:O-6-methylguanine DNA methyltransferase
MPHRREEFYTTALGVGSLTLEDDLPVAHELPDRRRTAPAVESLDPWSDRLRGYFAGERVDWRFDLDRYAGRANLTPFETDVVRALARVPYGSTVSYRDLATAAGRPGAFRAVGSVMARNRLPVILPCHRVIYSDGRLGPYGDDPTWKPRLLRLEGVPIDATGRADR